MYEIVLVNWLIQTSYTFFLRGLLRNVGGCFKVLADRVLNFSEKDVGPCLCIFGRTLFHFQSRSSTVLSCAAKALRTCRPWDLDKIYTELVLRERDQKGIIHYWVSAAAFCYGAIPRQPCTQYNTRQPIDGSSQPRLYDLVISY
jgi:hypothetical protein